MKILSVSNTDLTGSRFNGYDLFPLLRGAGHDPAMLVWDKFSLDSTVHLLREGWVPKIANAVGNRLDRALSLRAVAVAGSHFIPQHPVFRAADVVHLGLLHATPFFSLLSLPRIARLKPTVWTLHDPWALTGHCVHPLNCTRWEQGCGQCPDLGAVFPIRFDTTRLMFRYKKEVYARANLDIIVTSSWMRNLLERSPLLHGHRVHVIPFGLDLKKFHPANGGALRQALGIAQDAFVVLFRRSEWSLKGADIVIKALQRLKSSRPVHVLTLQGRGGVEELAARFPVTELGWVENEALLVAAYSASDVFVAPSHESFCMMALESLACGTPVICLEGSAVTALCRPPSAGLTVPENAPDELTARIEQLIDNPQMCQNMREQAVRIASEYSLDKYAHSLLDVYAGVIERHVATHRTK